MNTPFWKKFLFFALPFLGFLFLAEAGLRLGGQFDPVRVLCFHPIYEREYCANAKGILKQNNPIHINDQGMLDRNYPLARQPGSLRVAVLGDSMTAGEEVPQEKRYHELWERWLPKRLGRDVEVLNFGVRGFGTWESLQMFHLKAKKFQPDVTVLGFYWGNDVENNLTALLESHPNPLRSQYEISLGRRANVARKDFNKWLWNHSAVYHLTRKGYNLVENNIKNFFSNNHQKPVRVEKLYPSNPQEYELAKRAKPFQPPPLGEDLESPFDDKFFFDSEGWYLTRRLIQKLNYEVRQAGSQLVILHFMDVDQYYDYPPLPLKQFDAFLKKEDIPALNLHPAFQRLDRAALYKNVFEDDTHFNSTGHRFLAQHSIDFLVRQILGSGRVT